MAWRSICSAESQSLRSMWILANPIMAWKSFGLSSRHLRNPASASSVRLSFCSPSARRNLAVGYVGSSPSVVVSSSIASSNLPNPERISE